MYLTILKPGLKMMHGEVVIGKAKGRIQTRPLMMSDYVQVSHLDVRGTWEMADCMSAESRAKLARWANQQEERAKHELARRRHAGI